MANLIELNLIKLPPRQLICIRSRPKSRRLSRVANQPTSRAYLCDQQRAPSSLCSRARSAASLCVPIGCSATHRGRPFFPSRRSRKSNHTNDLELVRVQESFRKVALVASLAEEAIYDLHSLHWPAHCGRERQRQKPEAENGQRRKRNVLINTTNRIGQLRDLPLVLPRDFTTCSFFS